MRINLSSSVQVCTSRVVSYNRLVALLQYYHTASCSFFFVPAIMKVGRAQVFFLFLFALAAASCVPARAQDTIAATDAPASEAQGSCSSEEKAIALLATPSRLGDLVKWCRNNRAFMIGRTFLIPPGSSNFFFAAIDPTGRDVKFQELNDILVASQIVTGQIS